MNTEAEHSGNKLLHCGGGNFALISHEEQVGKGGPEEGAVNVTLIWQATVHIPTLGAEQLDHAMLWVVCHAHRNDCLAFAEHTWTFPKVFVFVLALHAVQSPRSDDVPSMYHAIE